MALETAGGSAEVSESVSSESSSAPSESTSEYSATDPGYSTDNESEVSLESLTAENTTETSPSEKLDDASEVETDSTEETAETPSDDAAKSDDFSDELLDKATELGYSLEDLKGFRSAKSLAKDIARVEAIQKRLQERQAVKQPVETAAPAEKPEPDWDGLIEAGHDPDMIAMKKEEWQELQATKAEVRQLRQAEQIRAFNAECERFDETLNKLDGFEKILGNGRKDDVAKASPSLAANRQKVFTTMQILKRGYEEAGVKVPSEAELIEAAAMASFPKHAQQTARNKLKNDIKNAGSQSLSRPHSTGAKPLSGAPLAASKEDAFWKKMSVN